MREDGWYVVGVWMGGVYVLWMGLGLIGWSASLGEELVRYNWLAGKLIIPKTNNNRFPIPQGKGYS